MEFKDLIGKTIKKADVMRLKGYDDEGFLSLEFTDNSKCVIVANYGGYTGDSEDEYPTTIDIYDDYSGLEFKK